MASQVCTQVSHSVQIGGVGTHRNHLKSNYLSMWWIATQQVNQSHPTTHPREIAANHGSLVACYQYVRHPSGFYFCTPEDSLKSKTGVVDLRSSLSLGSKKSGALSLRKRPPLCRTRAWKKTTSSASRLFGCLVLSKHPLACCTWGW